MADSVQIAPFEAWQFSGLLNLYQLCFPQKNITKEKIERILHQNGVKVLTSVVSNQVIGFLYLHIIQDEATLMDIGVHPQYRGQKNGREMMSYLIEIIKKDHVSQLFLEVAENNQVALQLYVKFGFIEIRRRKKYYPSGEDAIEMKLEL